ncbi:type II toxin-antitoxin system HicB family antitoxin [Hymenobacter rubidus]|uniref:type II toxin-antitoxin system HicB family antitoxin n=1 Tax=Hymenobacter rubidus TaxID=1441626 RepID=UPI00191E9E43|nr:type II toxin-antitoxin system HicB family antitoxin [Hymenobacter rubidus]
MSDQVLKLTAVIEATESPGIFMGYIKEIKGIMTHGNSVKEVMEDLEEITGYMLEYKRDEALALLMAQTHQPAPSLKRMANLPYEIIEAEHAHA